MDMKPHHVFFCLVLIIMSLVSRSSGCVYRVEVGTGGRKDSGTDATMSLTLCSGSNCFLHVPNLAQYGTRGPSYDYFERGNRDLFEIPTNEGCNYPCRMIIRHDNSGNKPGWYVDFVYTGAYENNGVKRFESDFTVNRWLATSEWPYNTEAELNHCPVRA